MKKAFKIIFRILLVCFTAGVFGISFLYGVLNSIHYGPSVAARNIFVSTVMETYNGRFLAQWFHSEEEINAITQGIGRVDFTPDDEFSEEAPQISEVITEIPQEKKQEIELINISGPTYNGKLLIVADPSRVSVVTSQPFQENGRGMKLKELAASSNSIAAINGGAFADNGGDMPLGLVISGGELLFCGDENKEYVIVGFNYENKLITDKITAAKAIDMGIRDAISFSPILIKDGKPTNVSGYSLGLNPRTAIGQRADGAVLLLVVDGRQPQSLGATYQDLINIMTEYGAVNACTLDGGSSSLMVYEGEVITKCCSLYGPGRIPTCFAVAEALTDE